MPSQSARIRCAQASDPLALGREALEAVAAPHERDAELVLQPPDRLRERRLGDVAGRRGARRSGARGRARPGTRAAGEPRIRTIDRLQPIERSGKDIGMRGAQAEACWSRRVEEPRRAGPPPSRRGAPTALEVLKEAMDARGEITDDDRRAAAERSGLPEAAVYGVSTFYDDLLQPRGARHVRVCTGTACFAATGDAHVDAAARRRSAWSSASAATDGSVSLAETVCLGFCHSSPRGPRRRRDRRRARAWSSACSPDDARAGRRARAGSRCSTSRC